MKYIRNLLITISLALILCPATTFAKNNVSEIDIDVTIRDDGSAYIVQNWQGTFQEGTENYIPINTEDISKSEVVLQAKMDTSCFYPFIQYNDHGELCMSYTINRKHIRLAEFTLSKYI